MKVKLDLVDPTGVVLESGSLSIGEVNNDKYSIAKKRFVLYIGDCMYMVDDKGVIIDRIV